MLGHIEKSGSHLFATPYSTMESGYGQQYNGFIQEISPQSNIGVKGVYIFWPYTSGYLSDKNDVTIGLTRDTSISNWEYSTTVQLNNGTNHWQYIDFGRAANINISDNYKWYLCGSFAWSDPNFTCRARNAYFDTANGAILNRYRINSVYNKLIRNDVSTTDSSDLTLWQRKTNNAHVKKPGVLAFFLSDTSLPTINFYGYQYPIVSTVGVYIGNSVFQNFQIKYATSYIWDIGVQVSYSNPNAPLKFRIREGVNNTSGVAVGTALMISGSGPSQSEIISTSIGEDYYYQLDSGMYTIEFFSDANSSGRWVIPYGDCNGINSIFTFDSGKSYKSNDADQTLSWYITYHQIMSASTEPHNIIFNCDNYDRITDNASANPDDIMIFFDGFEQYDANYELVNAANGGWRESGGGSSFKVYNSFMNHTNKIYAGDKTCFHSVGGMYHTFPSTTDIAIRLGIWDENANKTPTITLTHSVSGEDNFIIFGMNTTLEDNGYRFYSRTSGAWIETDSGNSMSNSMHEFIFYISSANGASFITEGGITQLSNAGEINAGYQKMDLHTVNQIRIAGTGDFFVDHIRIYKTFSTPDPFQVI